MCLWLPRVTLAMVMVMGVYVLMSGNEEDRLARQLSAHRSRHRCRPMRYAALYYRPQHAHRCH